MNVNVNVIFVMNVNVDFGRTASNSAAATVLSTRDSTSSTRSTAQAAAVSVQPALHFAPRAPDAAASHNPRTFLPLLGFWLASGKVPLAERIQLPGTAVVEDGKLVPSAEPGFGLEVDRSWLEKVAL